MDESKLSLASNLLMDILFCGPINYEFIQKSLDQAGISERTARTVKSRLGIISVKSGGRGAGWRWSLPNDILQPLKSFAAFEINLPENIKTSIHESDRLAIKARLVDQIGNQAGAVKLRAEYDSIYSQIWQSIGERSIISNDIKKRRI